MELAMGAMGPLFPKLLQLLENEYVRQRGLKREVESLSREMEMLHATLVEVSRVPPDKLSEPDKLWVRHIRELSYDMEDAIDAFMVRVARGEADPDANIMKRIARKATSSIKKIKQRHHISDKINDIKNLSKELSELRTRYKFSGGNINAPPGIDPRVINLYKNEGDLVGIEEARDQVIQMLMHHPPPEDESLMVVSIVGSGGLGKTTLAKLVHDQLKAQPFECSAFVSVGRQPNLANTLREMLEKLLEKDCTSDMANWSVERCCQKLRDFLQGKRYNIVLDDVWEKETWEIINCALPDSNCGSKVIMTTRNSQVRTKACNVYKLQPLPPEKSKELFYKRTTSSSSSSNGDDKLVDKIIGKCDGVPLAIIAMASLLVDRPLEDWQTVYDSLIFGGEEDRTRTILLYSYYDLPSYLKPCLLYLSMYPEDSFIDKRTLIWRWIAEGFVHHLQKKKGDSSLFEIGERYFDELLNRSMIQPGERRASIIDGCRVHDIVLDLIRDLSAEENFVTVVLDKKQLVQSSSSSSSEVGTDRKVRRLSIQDSESIQDNMGMAEVVRSLDTLVSISTELFPALSSFQACRVLAFRSVGRDDLKHVCKLLHLRYLEIYGIEYKLELPREIGNLKSLQTLILPGLSLVGELPPTFFELTKLTCLHSWNAVKVPAGRLVNLVCLEELKLIVRGEDAVDFMVALGRLTRLRVLEITFNWYPTREEEAVESLCQALVRSLNSLEEMRELRLREHGMSDTWESWEPPRHLWSLGMDRGFLLADHGRFRRLRYLSMFLEDADMENLALLSELLYLELYGHGTLHQRQGYIIGSHGFKNLRVLKARIKFKFLQGAMPRLESLCFFVNPQRDLHFNLANLVSLKEVIVEVESHLYFPGDVEQTESELRREAQDHPRRPTLKITRSRGDLLEDDDMKPDKVVYHLLSVRDCISTSYTVQNLRVYRWLEEITCDIDCEGSTLSRVERVKRA